MVLICHREWYRHLKADIRLIKALPPLVTHQKNTFFMNFYEKNHPTFKVLPPIVAHEKMPFS